MKRSSDPEVTFRLTSLKRWILGAIVLVVWTACIIVSTTDRQAAQSLQASVIRIYANKSYPPVTSGVTESKEQGVTYLWHMCQPDHIAAQVSKNPMANQSTSQPGSIAHSNRFFEFDGSASNYLYADVWPSISSGEALKQDYRHYYRLYVFDFFVDEITNNMRLSIFQEIRYFSSEHNKTYFEYNTISNEMLRWWTGGSPDGELVCGHSYTDDPKAIEHTTRAFVNTADSADLYCPYSIDIEHRDKMPTFTTLMFRSKVSAGGQPQHPLDDTVKAEPWQKRWRVTPDFHMTMKWCQMKQPLVYASAYIKPLFGFPEVSAQNLLSFIHWNRIIGIDHFYVYDRYGEILPAANRVVQRWKSEYADHPEWKFYSLEDYINSGVVTYIPAPCQHNDPERIHCGRYQDHLTTGETTMMLAASHAKWILQMDIDEYLYVFPPVGKPAGTPPTHDPTRSFSSATPQQILAAAEQAAASYYPRECGNSLHCPSVLRDWLDTVHEYGMVHYRVWTARVGYPDLADKMDKRFADDISKGAKFNLTQMIADRHWPVVDKWPYFDDKWTDMHEKYICQPKFMIQWGVHEGWTTPLVRKGYFMPDQGVFAAHYKEDYDTRLVIDNKFIRMSGVATIMDTIPAPSLHQFAHMQLKEE